MSVFTVCLSLHGLLLMAGGKPSVLIRSTFHQLYSSVSPSGECPVALNFSTCTCEISGNAWEIEQSCCFLKRVQCKAPAKEVDLDEIPFSLKSNTLYDITKKHSVSSLLTWADAHTGSKLVCCPQLWLIALCPCSWVPDDTGPGPLGRSVVAAMNKFTPTGTQKSCGEKGSAWPLSKSERGPWVLPGQALLIFWVQSMEEGPHLLSTGSLLVIAFYR